MKAADFGLVALLVTLILLLPLLGCGTSRLQGTADAFKQHTAEWNQLTNRRAKTPVFWGDVRSLSGILLGKTTGTVVAACSSTIIKGKWHDKHVVVNTDRWMQMGDYCFELLVVTHELVHCELEVKEHDDDAFYELEDGTLTVNVMSSHVDAIRGCDLDSLRQQVRERWSIGD